MEGDRAQYEPDQFRMEFGHTNTGHLVFRLSFDGLDSDVILTDAAASRMAHHILRITEPEQYQDSLIMSAELFGYITPYLAFEWLVAIWSCVMALYGLGSGYVGAALVGALVIPTIQWGRRLLWRER